MPSIGPTLPPHLAKRGRDEADDRDSSPESSDKRPRIAGPTLPPQDSRSRSSSTDSDIGPAPPPSSKPARVIGPAPPPASLEEQPQHPPNDDDSDSDSSDDDFGPAPPPPGGAQSGFDAASARSAFDTEPQFAEAPKAAQRDEWMTMPPTQDDLAARMDPTKMRARKFNTGKGAGNTGGMSSAWTETPEQKLKRLQDEALGISAPTNAPPATSESKRSKEEERRARKMREKIESSRGKSLVEQHQEKGIGKEKEDDPSKRVFDYEKDMAVGGMTTHKQRRDMLNKSKGFSDRFSSGNYL
jgi:hypothetical protein